MVDFAGENNPNFKHGLTDGNSFRHPVYTAWQNMKARCYNKNNEKYHCYGKRGITICSEWMDSKSFAQWAFSNGWKKGLSLDRIDNDGNYEPNNCQWILINLNARKRSTVILTIQQAKTIRQRVLNGEHEYNVCRGTVYAILNNLSWDESL